MIEILDSCPALEKYAGQRARRKDKDLYRQIRDLSSSGTVQPNRARVFRQIVSEVTQAGSQSFPELQRTRTYDEVLFKRRYRKKIEKHAEVGHGGFIHRAARLDAAGHTDAALDLLYDSIDELLRTDQFAEVDSILRTISPEHFSADLLLGILTATLPARSRLHFRSGLLKSIALTLRARGEYEDGLLTGLN